MHTKQCHLYLSSGSGYHFYSEKKKKKHERRNIEVRPMPLSRTVAVGPHEETEEKGNSVSFCVVSYKIHTTSAKTGLGKE